MAENSARRTPPRAARGFNKVALRASGTRWMPMWATIEHRGRKSGTAYRTPVAIVVADDEAIYVGLPWGRTTDWVRNLQAAGGTIVWKGDKIPVTEVSFVDRDQAAAACNSVKRQVVSRMPMRDFLRIARPTTS
ncbi:MAG: nitroreductase family deazaflavin-dependent oxidoreductase [Nocardioides sp.]|uniref:nitroreductase family deazaflavin-dependent oxidoreductase n=1 Tax=Nocardioides sp. TaxID=35761 RepID=UPI0039E25FAD